MCEILQNLIDDISAGNFISFPKPRISFGFLFGIFKKPIR